MTADHSVRDYLAAEARYQRVIELAAQGEDMNIDDLRRALDDVYNAGRDKGRPVTGVRRPLAYEISDNIVLIMGGGTSERGAREHTENLVDAASKQGYEHGYADATRKVLFALTGKEV